MQTLEIVQKLQDTTKRNEKESIINEAWDSGNREFFEAVQMAYDPMRVFHVKKVPLIEDEDDGEGSFSWNDFKSLANKLEKREITGNAARDALHDAASRANVSLWNNLMRRVLLKDLRCGITETTVNKILKKKGQEGKKYLVTKFGCQLANNFEGDSSQLSGEWFADQKFDGMRLVSILDKSTGSVTQFSRNGKEVTNFQEILQGLEKLLDELPGSIVLDGEVISRSFQDLMTQVYRKKDIQTQDAKLALFDIIPLNEFKAGESTQDQEKRHEALVALQGYLQEYLGNKAFVVPKKKIDFDQEDSKEEFQNFLQETVSAGYEGVVIKDPNSTYKTKRNDNWLKWKPTITVDLEIVDVKEGTGRHEGRLGSLICRGESDGYPIEVDVGSGYSDHQRDEYWEHKDELIGHIAEIMGDAITKNRSDSETYSIRFPRFIRFRDFDKGSKV